MNQYIEKSELNFLHLFWGTLFAPSEAARQICSVETRRRSRLFVQSLLVLILGAAGNAAAVGGSSGLLPSVILTVVNVLFLSCLFFIFSGRKKRFSLFLYLMCWAQAPMAFGWLVQIWGWSAPMSSLFGSLLSLWSLCLYGWAIKHAFHLSIARVILVLCLPVIVILFALVSMICSLCLLGS